MVEDGLDAKKRTFLMVDGVDAETKDKLRQVALQELGKPNVSLLVKSLISDKLSQYQGTDYVDIKNTGALDDVVRVEIRMPKTAFNSLERIAEQKLSTANSYLVMLAHKEIGNPQLFTDEIEVLRKSNYELARLSSQLRSISESSHGLDKDSIVELVESLKNHVKEVGEFMGGKTIVLDSAKRSGR